MIGETLKAIRTANEDMTIKDVANGTGLSGAYVCDLEKGKRKPTLETLKKFSNFYHIPLSKIMEIDEFNDICDVLSFQKTLIKVLEYYLYLENQEHQEKQDNNLYEEVKLCQKKKM